MSTDVHSAALVDSHCHLDKLDDPDAALERAREAGVVAVVTIATSLRSAEDCLQIAARNADVRVALGVPPQAASSVQDAELAGLAELCGEAAVCAIGETGFDLFRDYGPIERQHELWSWHVEQARTHDLPVVVHSRAADRDTLSALRQSADLRFVMHCFGMVECLDEVLAAADTTISFAGNVTFAKAQDLRDVCERVPAGRLLLETDAPYLAPVPRRGAVNEPALVVHTARAVAEVRGCPLEQLAAETSAHAAEIFGLAVAHPTTRSGT